MCSGSGIRLRRGTQGAGALIVAAPVAVAPSAPLHLLGGVTGGTMSTEVAVVNIDFSQEEMDLLRSLVEEARPRLLMEISRTDTHAFKEHLRQRGATLDEVSRKLGTTHPAGQT